jgi:hypothetical protein
MAKIGRQQRDPVPRLPAISISVKDGINGKSMPKVMQPRSARSRAWLEAGMVGNLAKNGLDSHILQLAANRGDEYCNRAC